MKAPKSLRKPLNWQDFETLCKKLWGEIWECREIQKNGRSGQSQNGVDVYGIPLGEKEYYGIQCKGKDEYADKQFTQQEVVDEIKKAKNFKPALKKLYFATSANKDVNIEEFIRLKNIEHIDAGLFEVHLFSWEDIVDLIEENRHTYSYYLESQNFKNTSSVNVSFGNGQKEITLTPKFKQTRTIYRLPVTHKDPFFLGLMGIQSELASIAAMNSNIGAIMISTRARAKINLSYVKFDIMLTNTGSDALEEYKLFFNLDGELSDIAKTNVSEDFPVLLSINNMLLPSTYVYNDDKSGKLIPRNNILVGDDKFISEDIYIKPSPVECDIKVKWKLISRSFKSTGTLIIHITPEMKFGSKEVDVDNIKDERIDSGEILDFIVNKD